MDKTIAGEARLGNKIKPQSETIDSQRSPRAQNTSTNKDIKENKNTPVTKTHNQHDSPLASQGNNQHHQQNEAETKNNKSHTQATEINSSTSADASEVGTASSDQNSGEAFDEVDDEMQPLNQSSLNRSMSGSEKKGSDSESAKNERRPPRAYPTRQRPLERRETSASVQNHHQYYNPVYNPSLGKASPNMFHFRQNQSIHGGGHISTPIRMLTPTFIQQKVEGKYRMFAPVKASDDSNFNDFGDVAKETISILSLLLRELEKYGLTATDIVRMDTHFVDVQNVAVFNDVLANFFPEIRAPQRQVIETSVPEGCSVQVEITCYNKGAIPNSLGMIQHDNMSVGNTSHVGSPAIRNKSHFTPEQQGGLYNLTMNQEQQFDPMRRTTQLGDFLPACCAWGYGYYGEMWERVKAGVMFLTVGRFLLMICTLVSFSMIVTSNWNDDGDGEVLIFVRSTVLYLILVAVMAFCHAFFLCIYGCIWLYFNAQCVVPGYLFNEDAPDDLVGYHSFFIKASKYGDFLLLILTLSSSSALFPIIITLRKVEEDDDTRDYPIIGRFLVAALSMFVSFILYMFMYRLSCYGLKSFRKMGKKLPRYKLPMSPMLNTTGSQSNVPAGSSQPTVYGHPDHISEGQTSYPGTHSASMPVRY